MRILLVVHCLGSGGAEMLVRNLALEYARRGHEVCVAYVSDAVSNRASVEFEVMLKADFKAASISVEEIGHSARRRPWAGARNLRRIVDRFKPDIVHAHVAYGLIFQIAGLIRVPTVYTHHNIHTRFPPYLFKLFDRFVDLYVAICQPCASMLKQHVRKPVEIIYNGVPECFSSADRRTKLPGNPLVLAVGAFTGQKDYGLFLEAAARTIGQFDREKRPIRFQIAGSGPEEMAIRQKAADLNLMDRVEFLGTRTDVADLMSEADLLVNSSLYEGLPITLIEGVMSALPIVATDVGGTSEIVHDGVNGFLVPPRRADLLSRKIAELLSDEERYVGFSRAAKEASKRFTLEECASQHLAAYERVAGLPLAN